MAKEVFGIDLGTTYSCIAEISSLDKLPKVIKNVDELQTTPSVVFFDDFDTPIVGLDAKNSMKSDPLRAVAFIKREMSNPNYKRNIGTQSITPVKISAMILKKLVDDANLNRQYRGKGLIKDVVITVPAYFGNDERELTKQAGEAAGLNVLSLLNEPTAAALSYGAHSLEGKTFMVYDLGGGTFDVSIMKVCQGDLVTLSTDGDHHLGGIDWDKRIVDYILQNICGVSFTYDSIKETKDAGNLILAAEQCKKLLSKNTESPIRFRYNNRMYTKAISRTLFEDITSDLLEKTIDVIKNAINLANQRNLVIDEIILVGGSSYMPMVKNRLTREFPFSRIKLDQFEPDLAVAKGAAIHAYNLANPFSGAAGAGGGVKISKDLGSRSYGIGIYKPETKEELISNVILRTDSLIYQAIEGFQTNNPNQSSAKINIYENKSVKKLIPRSEGKLIMGKSLSWGYPVPEHTKVSAKIKRGPDGIIHIAVECQNKEIEFEIKPDNALSEYELERLKKEIGNLQL